jgi:glycosyltransferase involved in cell wall biosynthesis
MRLRILHQFFYPDQVSTAQILADLAFYLVQQGHQVDVIASRGGIEGGVKLPKRETVQGVLIRRVWSPSLGKKNMLARIADLTSYSVGCTIKALFSRRVDRVIILTNPPMFAVVGLLLQAVRREPYVHIVMDLYPDVAVQAGVIKSRSLAARMGHWLTRITLKGARKVVVLGTCMAKVITDYGTDPRNIEIIRNWGDDKVTPLPSEHNPVRKSLGLTNEFVVMYSGNMGVGHRFDDILDVALALRDRRDIRFLFVGGGVRRREVESFRERHKLDTLIIENPFPREQLAYSLPAGDVHFVSLRQGFEGLIVPCKAYGIMAAGRPIIYQGNGAGEIARMLQSEGGGKVIAEGDKEGLRQAILDWAANRQRAREVGRRAREVLETSYTKAISLRRYAQVLQEDSQ